MRDNRFSEVTHIQWTMEGSQSAVSA